jgi:hypothetical protein
MINSGYHFAGFEPQVLRELKERSATKGTEAILNELSGFEPKDSRILEQIPSILINFS